MSAPSKVVAVFAAATTACLAACSAHTVAPAKSAKPSMFAVPGLGPETTLPAGFRVLGTWRLQAGRTNFLTALGGDFYWLTDGRHAQPDEKAPLHRIERLDPATGEVSVVADSGKGEFSSIAAGTDALAVVLDRPARPAECGAAGSGAACVAPLFESIQPETKITTPLATSDPQPQYADGGYSIDQTTTGVLLEAVHHGRRTVASWESASQAPRLVLTDVPSSDGITAVGSALVGQYYGESRIWTVGGPPLPAGAARGGLNPTGAITRLAWYTAPSPSADDTVYVAAIHGHAYTTPVRVTSGDVDVLQFATDCLLYIREFTGLFVAHVCQHGTPVERLLTAGQADQIYNPARFAVTPGRFAFAVKERDAEVVVLLQTPTN